MRTRVSPVPVALALVCLALVACAQQVGDIDRTQAGLVAKSVFAGDWFLRRTVISVPYDAGYTFEGEQEDMQRIRWDIQRDLLVAMRVLPLVDGTPDAAPVAAFKIDEHVDVLREYNAATGEATNVIVENTSDRMWYERSFLRVDWSKNLVTNYSFYLDQLDVEAVAYHVEDPSDPDSVLLGVRQPDGSWVDTQDPTAIVGLDAADYLDVVSRVFVKPELITVEDYDGTLLQEPACWYYLNDDCAPAVVSIRNSFLKVSAATSDYEPLRYPDNAVVRDDDGTPVRVRWTADGNRERVASSGTVGESQQGSTPTDPTATPADPYQAVDPQAVRLPFFDKFGYFRVERFGYDRWYGEIESARTFLITRWNLWTRSHDDQGQVLPYAERGVRPIVYYLSPDFPEELVPGAQKAVDAWNESFRRTVGTLTGTTPPGRVFELRPNSRKVDETGKVVRRGEPIGDLRYSHLYYVANPTRAGLLGFGPSSADPFTGEIVAADAFIYGAGLDEVAAKGKDIIDLINGRLDPADEAYGQNVQAYVATLRAGGKETAAPSAEARARFHREHPGPFAAADGKASRKRSLLPPTYGTAGASTDPRLERVRRPAGWAGARLAVAQGTGVEDLALADRDLVALKGLGVSRPGTASLTAAERAHVSPVSWAGEAGRRRTHERLVSWANHRLEMTPFYDDAVAGLALQLKDLPAEQVLQELRTRIFKSAAEHEIGHTLGLRHNFEASSDALNYPPQYWALRGETPEPLAPLTVTERDGKLRQFQYSSIMDYMGRFNTDIEGLGYYDHAAIAFGYGLLLDTFETPPAEPMLAVVDAGTDATGQPLYDRPFTLDEVLRHYRHYTKIPGLVGGTANLARRVPVPYTREAATLMGRDPAASFEAQATGDAPWTLWEVPYRFCSDEYESGSMYCHMFDQGADAYEIVSDVVDRYWNYYWFNNFKRDRISFDEWDYMSWMNERYFALLLRQYQNWVFDQWFVADRWEWLRSDPQRWGIEDKPFTEAIDAGGAGTAAAMTAFGFLQQVLAQPEPGAYMYDFAEGYYWALSENALPQCESSWSYDSSEWCSDANLGLGDGRWFWSAYDWESGYYFYERLKWVGTFYDKLLALETLTNPDTYFLGVDTASAADQWVISMYLTFPKEVRRLFGGIAADRFDLYAGTFDATRAYVPPDPFAEPGTLPAPDEALGPVNGRGPVDPSTSFTVQLYMLWYGMAWLNANFDPSFNNQAKIWLKGSGESIDPADPAKVVELADPFSNRVYRALAGDDAGDPALGALMLQQGQRYLDDYAAAAADPYASASNLEYYRWRVENLIENVEVVRGMYDLYGTMVF
jgi:hypothetical protein